MKKKNGRWLAALFMAATLCLTAGCAGIKPEVTNQKEYSAMLNAVSGEHNVGKEASDGWEASVSEESESGRLFGIEKVSLSAGIYEFSALMQVDAAGGQEAVGLLVATDAATGEVLGRREVVKDDFDRVYTYEQQNLTFALYRPCKVDLSFLWYRETYVKVATSLKIQSASAEKLYYASERGKSVLGADLVEEELEPEENTVYLFNLYDFLRSVHNSYDRYDLANLLFTLQGLANREEPRLFINFTPPNEYSDATDVYWYNELRKESFLGSKNAVSVKYPITLLNLFRDEFEGFAVWDENVPATSNSVATACGVDNLLPLRHDATAGSIEEFLTGRFADKPVKIDLTGKFDGKGKIYGTNQDSTGSAKNDAILWAKAAYLDTEKTNPLLMAYHVDAYTADGNYRDVYNRNLSNRDYYIAGKAFFFDTNPWEASVPNDDTAQAMGTDYNTMRAVLKAQNLYAGDNIVTVGGFVPWHVKYTVENDATLPGVVPSEWQSVRVFSEFNCVIDPDAYGYTYMTNASVYQFYPGKASYVNKARAKKLESAEYKTGKYENKNYILHYMGDYDASAWLNTMMIGTYFNDAGRGKYPLMWPIASNAYKRVPHVIDKLYEEQTDNDYFVYVNNGIGYMNPLSLTDANRDSELNGSLASLKTQIAAAGEKFDLDVQGLILTDGTLSKEVASMYAETAPYGVVGNYSLSQTDFVFYEGVPFIYEIDIAEGTPQLSAKKISIKMNNPDKKGRPYFFVFRTTLRTATFINQMYDYLAEEYPTLKTEVLDPYTFFQYAEQYGAAEGAK